MPEPVVKATFGDVYERLRERYPDPGERGRRFEHLVAEVLKTDRTFKQRFAEVWHWSEYPDRTGSDIGIDIVARSHDGELTAIQCKCYDPRHSIVKADIDSFLANSQRRYSERMIVSTTTRWSNNAARMFEEQQPPVQRVDLFGFDGTTIDWDAYLEDASAPLVERPRKELLPHQESALNDVLSGFEEHDRGKLIMACGTGKTLTALRIAERVAGWGGRVLFAAPSISLVAQAMREWGGDAELPIRAFAVCSDVKVGSADGDSARTYDLPIPATTDPQKLAAAAAKDDADRLTVVFSTYQSMQVIRDAQEAGMPEFDLIVCDEAHRTTGYALKDEERSHFMLVHDREAVRARKRLYMTATPRIYAPAARQKAQDAKAYVASMDDETTYGPEFHRLGFAPAVEASLLSDYKVTILVVREDQIARDLQKHLDTDAAIDDVGRVYGCLNGLAKLDPTKEQFKDDPGPMHRAVAFSNTIDASKKFVDMVSRMQDEEELSERAMKFEAAHVDGKSGVLERARRLRWLGEDMTMAQRCHILSNARCLTEGIDVPALDAVLFLQPRKSQIDVVQAVGRVMRRAAGKKYGYIILPVVVPSDEDPANALDRNEPYAHVWQVLQALRSHDERFDAYINQIDLNRDKEGRVRIIGVGGSGDGDDQDGAAARKETAQAIMDFDWGPWRDAIYGKIVDRCGDRRYWEKWAESVTDIARRHHERIRALIEDPESDVGERFAEFVTALRNNLNNSITDDDAASMLSQHLITKPVFDALFAGHDFTESNSVSRVMQGMVKELEGRGLEAETAELESFYESVRRRVEGIDNAGAKQRVVTELYENFFRKAFPKDAERLGIVYTPVEIVDFIIRSVEDLLFRKFGASLSDEGVHVLDPFTGTGTFITRLIQSGYLDREAILRKYASELHANEIMLLAYYIAAVNIETAYAEVAGEYKPFEGIVLTDTFQLSEEGNPMDPHYFPRNNARAERQRDLDIRVMIGNPPWLKGQRSQNDDNQRQPYPTLDKAISETYGRQSSSRVVPGIYDSYVRAIRWASDRVRTCAAGGVVGLVTNSGFLDGKSFDGFRKGLEGEFHEVYVYNLRGNQRTSGETSRMEGGKVFGSGSRAGVAILLLVKLPGIPTAPATIRYRDIGDYHSREEKLRIIAEADITTVDWELVSPDRHGDWINQRGDRFSHLRPLIVRNTPEMVSHIFEEYSFGMQNKCDPWVYNSSLPVIEKSCRNAAQFFNDLVAECSGGNLTKEERRLYMKSSRARDPKRFSWTVPSESRFVRGHQLNVDSTGFRKASYRPFYRQHVYFDRAIAHSLRKLPQIFPHSTSRVEGIVVTEKAGEMGVLAVDTLPDDGLAGPSSLFLPRQRKVNPTASGQQAPLLDAEGDAESNNITDGALTAYRMRYGDDVTRDQVFAYVYGLLHSPVYRKRYATDLAKLLPRIPEVATAEGFLAYAEAGQRLLDLHIGYEEVEPYQLEEQVKGLAPEEPVARYRVEKMRWGGSRKEPDRSQIVYNDWITLAGIPDEAHEYVVGPRSALAWLIDRYQVKTDKASGIVNDVNDWGLELDPPNPRYIIDLVKRIVTVSVETVEIVKSLPPLDEAPID